MMTLRIHDTGGEADCFLINDTFMTGMIRMRRQRAREEGLSFKLITETCGFHHIYYYLSTLLSVKIFDQECQNHRFELCPPAILFADNVVSRVSSAISPYPVTLSFDRADGSRLKPQ